jgi:hypothetical protein
MDAPIFARLMAGRCNESSRDGGPEGSRSPGRAMGMAIRPLRRTPRKADERLGAVDRLQGFLLEVSKENGNTRAHVSIPADWRPPFMCSECHRALRRGMGRPRQTCSAACARLRRARLKREERHMARPEVRAYWAELNAWIRDPKSGA